jgi:hypothetical protein
MEVRVGIKPLTTILGIDLNTRGEILSKFLSLATWLPNTIGCNHIKIGKELQ